MDKSRYGHDLCQRNYPMSLMRMQLLTATLLMKMAAKIPRSCGPPPLPKGASGGFLSREKNGAWVPQYTAVRQDAAMETKDYPSHQYQFHHACATELEADEFAAQKARDWIDKAGSYLFGATEISTIRQCPSVAGPSGLSFYRCHSIAQFNLLLPRKDS